MIILLISRLRWAVCACEFNERNGVVQIHPVRRFLEKLRERNVFTIHVACSHDDFPNFLRCLILLDGGREIPDACSSEIFDYSSDLHAEIASVIQVMTRWTSIHL